MNISKYYTPTIEEFYVGFECEIRNSSGDVFEWEPFKIIGVDDAEISGRLMDWSFYDSSRAIEDEQIRVKYLDKADFAELGFTHKEDQGMSENGGLMFTHPDPRFQKADITVRYWVASGSYRLRMERMNGCIFEGYIKNKSELKQLLQWLNIIPQK